MKIAAIYARVSSDKQKEEKTIVSQTEALIAFAEKEGYKVPTEWIFQDEGYSGTSLIRPGLERIRDLAAEGQIQMVLAYSPDRLSRKYAYQVLLMEEFIRHGVEMVFVKAPQSETPEDKLLLQFQGMISEYEHAQILERSRRGKLHKAKQGEASVLSSAPYGYRYIRKVDQASAYYEILEPEAKVIRMIFELYTREGLCLEAICRKLSELNIRTKKDKPLWTPATVRKKLLNPAYKGKACFGKTQTTTADSKVTRHFRLRGDVVTRNKINRATPREAWIEIPVPALVSEETFEMAQELLIQNKKLALRKTIEPTILQGLVYCHHCTYSLYRTFSQTKTRKIYYYRCLGADHWRHGGKEICNQKPIRLDLVDDVVWTEIMKLLEDPTLIQDEINRRLEVARHSDPTKQKQETLVVESNRTEKSMERLLTAYQEGVIFLDEFRSRISELRQRNKQITAEIRSIADQAENRATYLQLAETLSAFLQRVRANAENLDILERQRIVKLLVREVAIGHDRIIIRHSIPTSQLPLENRKENSMEPRFESANGGSDEKCVLYIRRTDCVLKGCDAIK